MRSRYLCMAAAAALLSITAIGQANATIFCELKQTSDGFVALRAAPAATGRVIGKMKVGDHLQSQMQEKGQWTRVSWWRKSRYPDGVLVGRHKPDGEGWMHGSLIVPDSCG